MNYKKNIFPRLLNLGIRGFSMLIKFFLIIILAKILSVEDIADYSLFVSIIGFSVILIGGEFYIYSGRELLSNNNKDVSFIVMHQLVAIFSLYLFLLPVIYLLFIYNIISFDWIFIFYMILISEHIAQEIGRLLVVMEKQLSASIIIFFRTGAWALAFLLFYYFDCQNQSLIIVLEFWFTGSLLSVLIGMIFIFREIKSFTIDIINLSWIKVGFITAIKFFIATVFIKYILSFDRYIIELVGGKEELALYSVYISIAMVINAVLNITVFSFVFPKLIKNYKHNNFKEYSKNIREMILSTIGVVIFMTLFIVFISPYVFVWIDKPIYINQLGKMLYIIFFVIIYTVSMIPHYILYAKGCDKQIMIIHVFAGILFSIGSILCIYLNEILIVYYMLIIIMSFIFIAKMYYVLNNKINKR